MDKHTPAPWFTTRPVSFGTIYVEARLTAPMVQEVAAVGPTDGAGQQEANARLIAAAPTMYAFIEKRAAQGDPEAIQILGGIHANS